ncbi:MAG: UvrB/UvrC motif-containing protein [Pseudomonadota bacterium]
MELKEKVKRLPSCPGVYLMKDASGSVIYVGKSKNLKSRVGSYFVNSKDHPPKVVKLVKHLKDFEHIVTDTEFEAFLMECRLIKELQPLYNRLMKNQRSYCYIKVALSEKYPDITISEKSCENDGNVYFGPYTSRNTVLRGLDGIKAHLGIFCTSPSQKNSSCLNHSLGLCIGRCSADFPQERYRAILDSIISLIQGRDKEIIKEMQANMEKASERLDFESAARYRDCLRDVNYLVSKARVIDYTGRNRNIAVIEYIDDENIKCFLIKGSSVLSGERYNIRQHGPERLKDLLKSDALAFFSNTSGKSSLRIGRYEIDEAQIIYSYLKNKCDSRRHAVIPEKWLKAPYTQKLDGVFDKLLVFPDQPV